MKCRRIVDAERSVTTYSAVNAQQLQRYGGEMTSCRLCSHVCEHSTPRTSINNALNEQRRLISINQSIFITPESSTDTHCCPTQ